MLDAPDEVGPTQDAEPEVGTRVRRIRESLGLSQRDLASRSGMTNGAISLIEQNKTSPSIASLKKLLDGLNMTLGEFFAYGQSSQQRVFFKSGELPPVSKGPVTFFQLGGKGRNLEILHERYAAGGDTGEDMLSHEGEEGGIVLRGYVEVTVGDQRQILGPGDAYFFNSRVPHRFRAVGNEACEIISACAPPYL